MILRLLVLIMFFITVPAEARTSFDTKDVKLMITNANTFFVSKKDKKVLKHYRGGFLFPPESFLIFEDVPDDVVSVYTVVISGTTYNITKMVDKGKRITSLTGKKEKFWKYQLFDLDDGQDYYLYVYEADYKANKSLLKQVPDARTFAQKHPVLYFFEKTFGFMKWLF